MKVERLGILDYGVGGLDFYAKMIRGAADVPALYWADGAGPPYGVRSAADLRARVETVATAMREDGVTHLVLACNAASTAFAGGDWIAGGMPVLGVIEPAVTVIRDLGPPRVTVIGGDRTIDAKAYTAGLDESGVEVIERSAQPLSAFVEAGTVRGPDVDACLAGVLVGLDRTSVLVLACTHYMAVASLLPDHLPRLETVIDPAAACLRTAADCFGFAVEVGSATLSRHELAATPAPVASRPHDLVVGTGNVERLARAARRSLGLTLRAVTHRAV